MLLININATASAAEETYEEEIYFRDARWTNIGK